MQFYDSHAPRRARHSVSNLSVAARFPRLISTMQRVFHLSFTEATEAVRDYMSARDGIAPRDLLDVGSSDAVRYAGGPHAVVAATATYESRREARVS